MLEKIKRFLGNILGLSEPDYIISPEDSQKYQYVLQESPQWKIKPSQKWQLNQAVVQTFITKLSRVTGKSTQELTDFLEDTIFELMYTHSMKLESIVKDEWMHAEHSGFDMASAIKSCYFQDHLDENFCQMLMINAFMRRLEDNASCEKLFLLMSESPLDSGSIAQIGDYIISSESYYYDLVKSRYDDCINQVYDIPDCRTVGRQFWHMLEPAIIRQQMLEDDKKALILFGSSLIFYIVSRYLCTIHGISNIAVYLTVTIASVLMGSFFYTDAKSEYAVNRRNYKLFSLSYLYESYSKYCLEKKIAYKKVFETAAFTIVILVISLLAFEDIMLEDKPYVEIRQTEENFLGEEWKSIQSEQPVDSERITAAFYGKPIILDVCDEPSSLYLSIKDDDLIQNHINTDGHSELIVEHPDDEKNYNGIRRGLYVRNKKDPCYNRGSLSEVMFFDPEYEITTYIPYLPTRTSGFLEFTCYVYSDYGKELEFSTNPSDFFQIFTYDKYISKDPWTACVEVHELNQTKDSKAFRVKISSMPRDANSDIILKIKEGLAWNKEYPQIRSHGFTHKMGYPPVLEEAQYPRFQTGTLYHATYSQKKDVYEIPRGGYFSLYLNIENRGRSKLTFPDTIEKVISKIEMSGFTANISAFREKGGVRLFFHNVQPESEELWITVKEGAIINMYGHASLEASYRIPISFNDSVKQEKQTAEIKVLNQWGDSSNAAKTFNDLDDFTISYDVVSNLGFNTPEVSENLLVYNNRKYYGQDVSNLVKIHGLEYQTILDNNRAWAPLMEWDPLMDENYFTFQRELYIIGPFRRLEDEELYAELSPEYLEMIMGIPFEHPVKIQLNLDSEDDSHDYREDIIWEDGSELFKLKDDKNRIKIPKDGQPVHICYQYWDPAKVESCLLSWDKILDVSWENSWKEDYYCIHNREEQTLDIFVYTDKPGYLEPRIGVNSVYGIYLPKVYIDE